MNPSDVNLPMVQFGTQSYSSILFFVPKMEIETVCFDNPKLNPNNHYSSSTSAFVRLLTVYVVYLPSTVVTLYAIQYL